MGMNPRLLRPTASGFNPRSIAGLEAWYDAGVGITVQTGVQRWADQSGKGRDLIQNATNSQPESNIVTLNGRPTVTFNGTSHTMLADGFTVDLPVSLFMVFRYEADYVSGNPRVVSHGIFPTRQAEVFRNGQNDLRIEVLGTGTTTTVRVIRFRKNVYGVSNGIANNVPAGQLQQFNVWDFEFSGTGTLNPISRVHMAMLGTGSYGNVSIAEHILFGRILTEAEGDRVREYLGRKYNLAFQA
jgi:hypothetical protein